MRTGTQSDAIFYMPTLNSYFSLTLLFDHFAMVPRQDKCRNSRMPATDIYNMVVFYALKHSITSELFYGEVQIQPMKAVEFC